MTSRLSKHKNKILILCLGCFLGINSFLAWNFYSIKKEKFRLELNSSFSKTNLLLSEKIESFVHGLQGMGGIVRAYHFNPNYKQMSDYSKFRNDFNNFEGALGFGFIRRVPDSEIENYIKKVNNISPFFKYREISKNTKEHFVIEFIEPLEANKSALGLDVGSETDRRTAAEASMRTGIPVLTAPINLVQANNKGFGFLYMLPVYNSVTPPKTEEARMRDLVGWVYCPILAQNIFQHVMKLSKKMSFKVIDVTDPISPKIVYSEIKNNEKNFLFKATILAGQRKWLIEGNVYQGEYLTNLRISLTALVLLLLVFAYFVTRWWLNSLISNRETKTRMENIESWREAVLKGTNYLMIATDPSGIITVFNNAAEKALGYSQSEVINKINPGIFHDFKEVEQRTEQLNKEFDLRITPGFETFVIKSRLQKKPDTNEWTYITKSGKRFQVKLSITTMFNEKEEVIGYLGVAEDISSYKKMEQKLEEQRISMFASAKLSSLGEMAGGVAHEINNPLAIILGQVSLARDNISSPDFNLEHFNTRINKIEETTLRIAKIVKGLRAFSRDGANDSMVMTDLGAIFDDVFSMCLQRFKNHQIALDFSGDKTIKVLCRPVEISQILVNLLLNSYDAISSLEEKWIKVKIENMTNKVHIIIVDSGKGISNEVSDKMMHPFFTTKEVGKGTGLGLSISKGIAENHGGHLYFKQGTVNTTFIIELPI